MGKVSIVTLGCPKNLVDSDALILSLKNEGFQCTTDAEDAEIVIVNTCGFIEDAKKESIEEILKLRHFSEGGGKLVVFGCMAERYREELAREMPEIDAIWGVGEQDKIIEYCKQVGVGSSEPGGNTTSKNTKNSGLNAPNSAAYAYLKIAEGCGRGCTFCVIPSIRGPYQSTEPDKILKTAEVHVKAGVKELVLIAQDIGNYGFESGYNLASLIKDIASIRGDFWIRLLYLYPSAINDELLTVISDEDKVCKYLDIPFQHSEDKILKAMGRGGKKSRYMEEIRKIRKAIPDVTLRTTFIAGFPGETEEDFKGLRNFVEDIRFDRLGVFEYSKEEGTPAALMKGHVSKKTKEKRRNEIMEIQSRISLEKNKALIGKRCRALVDEIDGNIGIARLYSQAPEIDGVVFIEKGQSAGDFVTVEIIDAYDYDLKGVIVS